MINEKGIVEFRSCELSGIDFGAYDFTDAIVTHCDLTDCTMPANCVGANFGGCKGTNVDFSTNRSDLTGASFYLCESLDGFNLIGAIWAVEVIEAPPYCFTDGYWCMGTDRFLRVGCTIYPMEQAMGFNEADLRTLDPRNAQEPVDWWARNKQRVIDLAVQYSAAKS